MRLLTVFGDWLGELTIVARRAGSTSDHPAAERRRDA